MDDKQMWEEHRRRGLDESEIGLDPLLEVASWLEDARRAGVFEPEAMALATTDAEGRSSVRMVLLKGLDHRGFQLFTNHSSRKARDLAVNPACALLLHWKPMSRQVCITGRAERLPDEESDDYFASRPRGSQIGAWASRQSEVILSREDLEDRYAELAAEYEGRDVPRPPFWGGYLVVPDTVELWQGRPDRLHDRLRYRRATGGWLCERLAP